MESKTSKKEKKELASKKRINIEESQKDIEANINLLTNLSKLNLNQKAIKGVFLYGCDIEENKITSDFNKVNFMRKARKLKCFQDKIKEYVPDYYISGLVLMGRPKNEKEDLNFEFFLKAKENKFEIEEGSILDELNQSEIKDEEKIYKFKFKRKEDLSKFEDKNVGDSKCIANYLNICLGKILKKCGYSKDRTSRKILYYKREEAYYSKTLGNSDFLYFPALKAVCEAYEGGIFMKLLPKRLLKTNYTYADYFYDLLNKNNNIETTLEQFKNKVKNKRAIKIYNQAFIKIENVIFDNPYNIFFKDKNSKEWSVGNFLSSHYKLQIPNEEMPIVERIIDKGGKLKGNDRSFIYIPCYLLEIIGNIFEEKINVKDLLQSPYEKYDEISYINDLIRKTSINSKEEELHNYLGDKFDPLYINGHILKPPLIIFDNNDNHEPIQGKFQMLKTSPYSKISKLKKVDIYLLDLDNEKGNVLWEKLKEASKELGIVFKESPNFIPINNNFLGEKDFEDFIHELFKGKDKDYSSKNNEIDFIFMFMDSRKRNLFYYKIFKSVINKFNWLIPTQVILYDKRRLYKKNSLSQFTNILCQMWAKKGNELYICDFSFIPKTMVVAYSSMPVSNNKILTSISISFGVKLYEYIFYSEITEIKKKENEDNNENKNKERIISPSIEMLLSKALITIGKHLKKKIENIVIYRDAVNEAQQILISEFEVKSITKAISLAKEGVEKNIYSDTKCCIILVSKLNEIKLFVEENNGGNNYSSINNIPVGTIVDTIITNKDKHDFYLNSAESRQGTCSSTHYTVIYDNSKLNASQIYKLTYYLTYLSYNTTKSIRVPAPLYFVTRRNKFTMESLNGEIINPKFRTLNISL